MVDCPVGVPPPHTKNESPLVARDVDAGGLEAYGQTQVGVIDEAKRASRDDTRAFVSIGDALLGGASVEAQHHTNADLGVAVVVRQDDDGPDDSIGARRRRDLDGDGRVLPDPARRDEHARDRVHGTSVETSTSISVGGAHPRTMTVQRTRATDTMSSYHEAAAVYSARMLRTTSSTKHTTRVNPPSIIRGACHKIAFTPRCACWSGQTRSRPLGRFVRARRGAQVKTTGLGAARPDASDRARRPPHRASRRARP